MKAANLQNAALLHMLLITAAVLTLFPLLMIVLMAFKTNQEIFANPLALPERWRFEQLWEAWEGGNFGRYYLNSISVTVPNVLIVVAASTMAAYALVFVDLPFRGLVLMLFMLGFIVPLQAIIVSMFYNLGDLGLINTHLGLVLVQSAIGLPFGIFLIRSFFLGIPSEIIEAARVDGASDLTILFRVVLPLSSAPLLTLATLQFMFSWNDFLLPLIILQDPSMRTVTLGLFHLQGGTYTLNYALISAGVVLTAVPIILVFFLLQRQFESGLTAGAVK